MILEYIPILAVCKSIKYDRAQNIFPRSLLTELFSKTH